MMEQSVGAGISLFSLSVNLSDYLSRVPTRFLVTLSRIPRPGILQYFPLLSIRILIRIFVDIKPLIFVYPLFIPILIFCAALLLQLSSVCLALSLVLLMAVFISCSFSDLSKLMTEVRRVEQHTVSTQGQAAAVRQKRGFQPRRARSSPEGLYYDDGVAPEICRAIAEAKRDFSRKGKACSLLVEGLLSRKMEASVTKRFGRWKRNAAAAKGVVKEAVDDAGGDEEKSKGEKAGDGW